MARLRRADAGGGDVSPESDFAPEAVALKRTDGAECSSITAIPRKGPRMSPRKRIPQSYQLPRESSDEEDQQRPNVLMPKTTPKKSQVGRQIQLKSLHESALSRPLSKALLPPLELPRKKKDLAPASPDRKHQPELILADESAHYGDDRQDAIVVETEVEESIWCGSNATYEDSEDELPSSRKLFASGRPPTASTTSNTNASTHPTKNPPFTSKYVFNSDSDNASRLPKLPANARRAVNPASRPASSSDKENQEAFLRFSPPRLHSPFKREADSRPVTPPQSPSRSRLQSPSKSKTHIPTPPLRQSLDAFWNADTVNDWNEQYSPKKILKSPRKLMFRQDESSQSPTSAPRKNQSPSKRTKAERDAKKTFADAKQRIAEAFLAELDQTITQDQIGQLAKSTGGVRLIWSKTLNSTAGRANWRKETTKSRRLDGTSETIHKHFASIELAEKVIDDEHRLLNVIAHEFCHLANFMISGIKDQPHGKQFKEWGWKCTKAFAERGVEVTTKHSYQIEYKFVWQCVNEECGAEFKRHSKSIDPARKVCGSCRGKLVQVKPIPRKGDSGGSGAVGYASYVKANFAEVKRGMPGASQKEVMEAVARKYRAEKEAKKPMSQEGSRTGLDSSGQQVDDALEKLTTAVEIIALDDD